MFRNLITLIEHNLAHVHVWRAASKDEASTLIKHSHPVLAHPSENPKILEDSFDMELGDFGSGFYTSITPSGASEHADDDSIILEYRISEHAHIIDLSDDVDLAAWHHAGATHYLHNPHMWKLMIRHGIDGVQNEHGICFYNLNAVEFVRVYSGVVDDPLADTDTNELDEFALGGLQRCTAVTVNALLKDFHLRPITLDEIPVDHPGVLRILDAKGLSYKPYPYEAGRTVQQFVAIHKLYDWYLLTPGHAMALIRGELFDAENKGADGRKLEAVFQVTRR